MVEYRNFFVRFSGDGGRMTLNEKDDCWEYICPGKGKIVAWLDPDDEEECVFLNVRFLDVDGNPLSKNESNASISYAIAFIPAGMAALEFRPMRKSLMMALPYGHGHWTKIVRPDQIVGLPALILFTKNCFDVDYLLIPERPEFFPREEMTPEREAIIKKMEAIKARMQEKEKEKEQEARENIQRANEEWDEWERRQAEENDTDRGK